MSEVTEDHRSTAEIERRRRRAETLKSTKREQRALSVSPLELREDAEDGTITLIGIACRTGVEYDVGWYKETILDSAFKRTLAEDPDVQLVVNHAAGGQLPLARTRSGTMQLAMVPGEGLQVRAGLDPDDPDVQNLVRKMKRGDVDGMSFAFMVTDDEWSEDFGLRTIRSLSLHRGDVSVVNQGANPFAHASIRSLAALVEIHGAEAIARARAELRAYCALSLEQRAGKTLSGATMVVLQDVLDRIAEADDAVDRALVELSDLMDVPNPNADDEAASAAGDGGDVERSTTDEPEQRNEPEAEEIRAPVIVPDFTTRARAEYDLLMLKEGKR